MITFDSIVKILNDYYKHNNLKGKGVFSGILNIKNNRQFPIIKTCDMNIYFVEHKIKTLVFSYSNTSNVKSDKVEEFKNKCSEELMCNILLEKYKLDEFGIK